MSPINSTSSSANLSSAQDSGRSTIATATQQLSRDAQQIADPNNENATNALLNSTQTLPLAQAGAAVISASNQMLGTLLNIFA
jgi:hypothetical protein